MYAALSPASHTTVGGGAIFFLFAYLALVFLITGGMWMTFVKAGRPGWATLIPFYNTYTLCTIAGLPGWWLVLLLIPFVNIIIAVMLLWNLAQRFDKGAGFALGLIFLPVIFWPILGFGSATYLD